MQVSIGLISIFSVSISKTCDMEFLCRSISINRHFSFFFARLTPMLTGMVTGSSSRQSAAKIIVLMFSFALLCINCAIAS